MKFSITPVFISMLTLLVIQETQTLNTKEIGRTVNLVGPLRVELGKKIQFRALFDPESSTVQVLTVDDRRESDAIEIEVQFARERPAERGEYEFVGYSSGAFRGVPSFVAPHERPARIHDFKFCDFLVVTHWLGEKPAPLPRGTQLLEKLENAIRKNMKEKI